LQITALESSSAEERAADDARVQQMKGELLAISARYTKLQHAAELVDKQCDQLTVDFHWHFCDSRIASICTVFTGARESGGSRSGEGTGAVDAIGGGIRGDQARMR
jgi:hypothetical protein